MTLNSTLSLIDVAGSERNWNRYKQSIETIVPTQYRKNVKRYTEMFLHIANIHMRNEKVTNKKSILTCMYNAPALGLNPDPIFGHIWFIPYKGVLTYQIGYKGMIQTSYNSGLISNVRANLVYENDEFDYYEDEKGQHYLHRPKFGKRGKEICGYSIFEDMQGIPHFHIMESEHIDGIKKMVLARMNGRQTPWIDPLFEPEMRKKTIIRRHWKTEPMSSEIARAINHEENTENGIVDTPEEIDDKIDKILEGTGIQESENHILTHEQNAKINNDIENGRNQFVENQVQLDTDFASKL